MFAYAYLRCSHEDSVKSGAGLAAQEISCLQQFEKSAASTADMRWGVFNCQHERPGFFRDLAVSAFKKPFASRPAGKALLAVAKPGDVIIVHKVDRMFRSLSDMVHTLEVLRKRKINVKFGDIPLDTRTHIGRMMLNLVVMMAEWESTIRSQRNKEAFAAKKALAQRNERRRLHSRPALPMPDTERSDYSTIITRNDPSILDTLPKKPDPSLVRKEQPGRILIYTRCSHLDSVESGLGLHWQRESCLRYAEALRAEKPHLVIVEEPFEDQAVSAWNKRLIHRPAGKRLSDQLQPGDHVLFPRLDRGFRSTRDLAVTLPEWQARGVSVHFVSEGMDLNTVWGKALIELLVVFAQIEPALTSARTKDALAELRKNGRGLKALAGFKWVVVDGVKSLVPDRRAISLMRLATFLNQRVGLSLEKTAMRIEQLVAKHDKRPVIPYQGLLPAKAAELFGDDDRWKERIRDNKRGMMPLVLPIYADHMTVKKAVQRWPLIRDYLAAKRLESRRLREQGQLTSASDPDTSP